MKWGGKDFLPSGLYPPPIEGLNWTLCSRIQMRRRSKESWPKVSLERAIAQNQFQEWGKDTIIPTGLCLASKGQGLANATYPSD